MQLASHILQEAGLLCSYRAASKSQEHFCVAPNHQPLWPSSVGHFIGIEGSIYACVLNYAFLCNLHTMAMETIALMKTGDGHEDFSSQDETVREEESSESSEHHKRGVAPEVGAGLKKRVSLIHGIGLVAGVIIGSGIFFTPSEILEDTGSAALSLVVWVAAGIISLGGALCYCELGASIPETGGEYVYLYRAYGPLPAFLLVWSTSLLTRPASQAIVSLAFARYLVQPFFSEGCDPSVSIVKLVAIAGMLTIGIVNAASVRVAVYTQNILLLTKILALLAIVLMGVYWTVHNEIQSLSEGFQGSKSSPSDIGLAFYNALWTYEGWSGIISHTEQNTN